VEVDELLEFYFTRPTRPFAGVNYNAEEADTWIIGVPFDATVSFKPGTRFAPRRIREVAWELETYNPRRRADVEELPIADLGDVPLLTEFTTLSKLLRKIAATASRMKKRLITIGGEHLITLPIVSGLLDPLRDSLLVFDAHLDLRDEYPMSAKYSHATVMRRIREEVGVEIYYYKPRAFSKEEHAFLKKDYGLHIVDDISKVDDVGKNIYLSIDMDAVDPAYAPAVGNPEPLGLLPAEILEVVKRLGEMGVHVKGVDVVEVNPMIDVNDITSMLAAKILLEILFLLYL